MGKYMYYLVPNEKFNTYNEFKKDKRHYLEKNNIIETDYNAPNQLIMKKALWTR